MEVITDKNYLNKDEAPYTNINLNNNKMALAHKLKLNV